MTGCKHQPPQHAAEGRWQGDMITQGVVIDIGSVVIGADFLSLPNSNLYYSNLNADSDSTSIRYSNTKDPAFKARVRLIDQDSASLQITGISGYIDLSRES
jgi:hypothetical protein